MVVVLSYLQGTDDPEKIVGQRNYLLWEGEIGVWCRLIVMNSPQPLKK